MFKREGGGAFSSGNSILMQRERGKKRNNIKKAKVRAVGKIGGTEAGGAGSGKVGRQTKKAEREQAEQQTGESKG